MAAILENECECNKRPFVLQDQIKLVISNQDVLIDKALSKSIYRELISGLVTPPTAQLRYNESFANVCLEWEQIYSLPFKVDTKLREFQYKVLNRYLVTNTFFKKNRKNRFFSLLLLWCEWRIP